MFGSTTISLDVTVRSSFKIIPNVHMPCKVFQLSGMQPCSSKSAIIQWEQDAYGNKARIAFFLSTLPIDIGAETCAFVVNKVYQVLLNIVQARRKALVLDDALEGYFGIVSAVAA